MSCHFSSSQRSYVTTMLPKNLSRLAVALCNTLCLTPRVSGQCNPVTATCSPTLALGSSTYLVDFTQQTTLPPNWTIANYETIDYGSNGAEFTFAKRYDAPYIWTNFHIFYGRVETVIQAAPGTGMISSSVLISDDLDEIDWEWSGNNFGTSTGKVQTNYYGKGITGNYDRGTQPSVYSPQTVFHTYTLDWTPTTLTWSVDGVVVRTLQNNDANSGAYQYPQSPMRVQIGLWDAGDADTSSGTVGWAGGYTDLSKVPFTMYVKSVKITTPNPCSGSWEYTDRSGSAGNIKCVSASATPSNSSNASILSTPAQVILSDASTSTSSTVPSTYTVVSGDTGYGIATKLGIPFTSLAAANPTVNWDLLLIGQILRILLDGPTSAVSTSAMMSSLPTSATPATTSSGTSGSATVLSAGPSVTMIRSSFNAATMSTLTSTSVSTSSSTTLTASISAPSSFLRVCLYRLQHRQQPWRSRVECARHELERNDTSHVCNFLFRLHIHGTRIWPRMLLRQCADEWKHIGYRWQMLHGLRWKQCADLRWPLWTVVVQTVKQHRSFTNTAWLKQSNTFHDHEALSNLAYHHDRKCHSHDYCYNDSIYVSHDSVKLVRARAEGLGWWPFFG